MSELGPRPQVGFPHLYVDAEGCSRFHDCTVEGFAPHSVGGADPQWNAAMTRGEATVVFTEQPVGWVGDWHENPAPQWIVVLSGRWWIEAMDGRRVEQGAGEFSFGGDQGCREVEGRKGHRSGTVGEEPCRLMTVQLHRPRFDSPCEVR